MQMNAFDASNGQAQAEFGLRGRRAQGCEERPPLRAQAACGESFETPRPIPVGFWSSGAQWTCFRQAACPEAELAASSAFQGVCGCSGLWGASLVLSDPLSLATGASGSHSGVRLGP